MNKGDLINEVPLGQIRTGTDIHPESRICLILGVLAECKSSSKERL